MFDSVLGRGNTPKSRFGVGAVVSVILHVGLVVLAVYLSTRKPAEEKKEVAVVFKQGLPPPPPPPPPAASSAPSKPHPTKPKVHHEKKIVIPKEPQEQPKEAEPQVEEPEEAPEEPVTGGVPGGVVGGVVGGQVGGQVGGTLSAVPFGDGMTRPQQVSGRPIEFSREAREAHVAGLMLIKCVIDTDGTLSNCRVIKPLPYMEKTVLDTISSWKFTPVTFQGHPVRVEYVIQLKLVAPNG